MKKNKGKGVDDAVVRAVGKSYDDLIRKNCALAEWFALKLGCSREEANELVDRYMAIQDTGE